jgi:hypothetical protein
VADDRPELPGNRPRGLPVQWPAGWPFPVGQSWCDLAQHRCCHWPLHLNAVAPPCFASSSPCQPPPWTMAAALPWRLSCPTLGPVILGTPAHTWPPIFLHLAGGSGSASRCFHLAVLGKHPSTRGVLSNPPQKAPPVPPGWVYQTRPARHYRSALPPACLAVISFPCKKPPGHTPLFT